MSSVSAEDILVIGVHSGWASSSPSSATTVLSPGSVLIGAAAGAGGGGEGTGTSSS
eukprot:CAMPEP_0182589858 /NCGR_PEP_ID=MMETSP1324-20130603/70429_1 /TAXON_ID=236786 /ORGANISM="Florenciella sp., Strain RCC1587" /LENGTH=55 /DNA_ID=CAMNT_0024807037 /DNA_START=13 /DNA_END=177 /DNA_ORIENTATION=+